MLDHDTLKVFEKAAQLGIRRTVHAGEAGPASMVWKVLLYRQIFVPSFEFSELRIFIK